MEDHKDEMHDHLEAEAVNTFRLCRDFVTVISMRLIFLPQLILSP